MFVNAAMITADGRCKTLDASADGYIRSEACVAHRLRYLVLLASKLTFLSSVTIWLAICVTPHLYRLAIYL